ncbi:MAG TPA: GNAT family N-acetyltransferase [Acidimicrobiales bacterium]
MTTVATIRRARPTDVAGLAEVLVDCVAGGASIGFMLPYGHDQATAFWQDVLGRDDRIVLVAEDGDGEVVGTAQVVFPGFDNQPHRVEVAKVLVHRRARRQGVGDALMAAVEATTLAAGRTLLVLDTASPDAERLYRRRGWVRVGEIPRFALWPDGGFVATTIFYKDLSAEPASSTAPSVAEPASR